MVFFKILNIIDVFLKFIKMIEVIVIKSYYIVCLLIGFRIVIML